MRICFANLKSDVRFESAEELLGRRTIHRGFGEALSRRGHDVHVVYLFPGLDTARPPLDSRGIRVHLVPPSEPWRSLGRWAARWREKPVSTHTAAPAVVRRILEIEPDLVHWHGTVLHLNHFLLHIGRLCRRLGGKPAPPVVAHHHGGYPSGHPILRSIQRFNLLRTARVLFTTREQAHAFESVGMLDGDGTQSELLIEASTRFRRREEPADPELRLRGDPAVLSVARLDPVKDPMTTIRGFEHARDRGLTGAALHMCYRENKLVDEIRTYLEERPELEAHVLLHGSVPHGAMEAVYNEADLFVQSSLREFSGYGLIEALACGAVPVVSDLPANRVLTDDGRVGRLFPPGEPEALGEALLEVAAGDLEARKDRAHAHFQNRLTYERLAAKLEQIYQSVLERGVYS